MGTRSRYPGLSTGVGSLAGPQTAEHRATAQERRELWAPAGQVEKGLGFPGLLQEGQPATQWNLKRSRSSSPPAGEESLSWCAISRSAGRRSPGGGLLPVAKCWSGYKIFQDRRQRPGSELWAGSTPGPPPANCSFRFRFLTLPLAASFWVSPFI